MCRAAFNVSCTVNLCVDFENADQKLVLAAPVQIPSTTDVEAERLQQEIFTAAEKETPADQLRQLTGDVSAFLAHHPLEKFAELRAIHRVLAGLSDRVDTVELQDEITRLRKEKSKLARKTEVESIWSLGSEATDELRDQAAKLEEQIRSLEYEKAGLERKVEEVAVKQNDSILTMKMDLNEKLLSTHKTYWNMIGEVRGKETESANKVKRLEGEKASLESKIEEVTVERDSALAMEMSLREDCRRARDAYEDMVKVVQNRAVYRQLEEQIKKLEKDKEELERQLSMAAFEREEEKDSAVAVAMSLREQCQREHEAYEDMVGQVRDRAKLEDKIRQLEKEKVGLELKLEVANIEREEQKDAALAIEMSLREDSRRLHQAYEDMVG
ncbi:hypothetical protein DXG03_002416 [Asterophora parasitica]|uniref:Uncharacterized protein n=1 Tax=Asterophora parasitica TaxID=117018 RepID=A0A9P7GA54_9AGAR|nr:hypothetical protein DXG03_002416 [Asterophora parasitica]